MYISIDGDDIGRRITAMHLANDAIGLSAFVELVHNKIMEIEAFLLNAGFIVIFCAADGVVAYKADGHTPSDTELYAGIEAISGKDLTFSAGTGQSLREAYIALMAAKSNGKAQLYNFSEMR